MMAHTLELAYNWRTPVTFATVGLSICIGVLVRQQANGWLPVVLILFVGWAGFLVLVWLRTRASLLVDGSMIRVRSSRQFHEVEGRHVTSVREVRTPHGPSYRLVVEGEQGSSRRVFVPAALLRRGHATFFAWILAEAPQAELDAASTRTLAELRRRGLVERSAAE
jgi:hypothetical protein